MPRFTSSLLLLIVLASCGDDTGLTGNPSTGVNAVRVSPSVLEMRSGESRSLQVTVTDDAGRPIVSPTVTWSSSAASVATVTNGGSVTGVAVGSALIIARHGDNADTADVRVTPAPITGTAVDVYPEVLYQEILGWEGTAQLGHLECNPAAFEASRPELLNRVVNELGINRVRLETRSGHENPNDYYAPFRSSGQPGGWNQKRYESINDNDDPRVANPAGFQFSEIDHTVQVIIDPMRALLQARGERQYVTLTYVDWLAAAFEQSSNPEEYAELILAVFTHLQNRYGWVPDAVEVILEPDNTPNWRPDVIGKAIVAAGDRLKAAGYRPAFIAPSNTNMRGALDYLNGIVTVPRVLEYLTDVGYHRYADASSGTVAAIATRANELGLRTAMLEHIGSSYQDLHEDLRVGQNSAWQQFTLAFCEDGDNGAHYYLFDENVQGSASVVMGDRTRYLRQYFSFIRLNARRVGAVAGDGRLDPLAFRNANGKVVAVIKTSAASPITLRLLPPGSYGVTFTTASQSFVALADVQVGASGEAQVTMPGAGVITIYQR